MKSFSHFMQKRVEITEAAAVTIVKGKRPNTWITSHGKYMIAKCDEYRGYAPIGKKIYCIYDGGPEANLIRRLRDGGQPDEVVDTLAQAKAMVMQWVRNEVSHDFKDFKDPWAAMSPEDRKETNRLTIAALKAMPSSPRQRELQAKRDALLKKYKIGQKKTVKEGVEHGDIPRPKKEYYTRPFNISGKIVELYPVYGVPVKSMKNFNAPKTVRVNGKDYTPSSSKDSPYWKDSAKVWRWRVRIQTTEGWMLMGYIGSVKAKEELPKIILGDTAFIENLTLSLVVGGMRTQYDRNANKEVDVPMDYRSNRYDRQLHGKVKRQSV